MFQVDWIKMWAVYTPERIAIEDAHTGQCFSYQDYFQYSCRLANHIKQEYNVSEGDRIAVLSTNEVEYFFLFDAIKRIGAIMVPINFRLTPPEISYILKDCQPSLFIHQQQYTETIQQIENVAMPKQVMKFDGPQGIHKIISDSNISDLELTMVGDLDTSCLILYTSGTTGFPKGAIISHGVMFWNSISTGLRLNLTQDDVTLSFLPFFHTGGWNVLTTPFLHRGAKQVFIRKFDPDQVLSLCDEKQVSILFGVPTTLDMMA
ncbi:MAG: long-chain fatty acid--CoA ligase, partial [Gammaproteobacteria bacterium]|nr:long-chain fatty acid--CoA ligase [Gammaproteobacteria bacterium]